jgi:hypothetical protein
MRASKWRHVLIGDILLLDKLRSCPLERPFHIKDQTTLDNDLRRTFPLDAWFNKKEHLRNLSTILMVYADTNPTIGYAQGMCFIVFLLYKVYYNDCPKHAVADTYYSLYTIMKFIRPLYPRDEHDEMINPWLASTSSIIRLKLLYHSPKLAIRLRGTGFIKLMLIKLGPTLFANWFSCDDTVLLWDHIFNDDIFDRVLNVLTAMIMVNKELYMNLSDEKILHITSVKSFYKISSVVSCAHTLLR